MLTIKQCPSVNTTKKDFHSSLGSLSRRRQISNENLPSMRLIAEEKKFFCPAGNGCKEQIEGVAITQHINSKHKVAAIYFGSSSAEISLPAQTPIKNASLILVKNNKQFWLKLLVDM
jgi:hypothetical protein